MAHTPGPWRYGELSECILTERGHCVASIAESDLDARQANARLMAAAPDLLEALSNITECAEAGTDGANMDLWISQARAAIAKARGE
jgi:hypothetical protein